MTRQSPVVSVVMSARNGENFISEAVESILNQTLREIELIVIDDGSSDGTGRIIRSYKDARIRIFRNDVSRGISFSKNLGIRAADGKYIAIMDCDDISCQTRLEKQVSFMESRPDIGVCGSWARTFGEREELWKYPVTWQEVHSTLPFNCPLPHSSAMIRRKIMRDHDMGYEMEVAEDYDLWEKITAFTRIANLPEVLVLYRLHGAQISREKEGKLFSLTNMIRERQVRRLIESPAADELFIHGEVSRIKRKSLDEPYLRAVHGWLKKLLSRNREIMAFPREEFQKIVSERWFSTFYANETKPDLVSYFIPEHVYYFRHFPWKSKIALIQRGIAILKNNQRFH